MDSRSSNKQYNTEALDYLKSHYHYNPITGDIWRKARGYNKYSSIVGYSDKDGYLILKTDLFEIKCHRAAWFLYYGELPSSVIDHIDRNPANNAIANLRMATGAQNVMNSKKHNNGSRSKYRGVSWNKQHNKWTAYIYANKKHIYIGSFTDEKDAARAYVKKADELYGSFIHYEHREELGV